MDIKAILGLVASPTVLAGLGGWLGYKYGKKASIKNKYVAGGVGVGAGWLIGKTLQSVTAPPVVAPPVQQITDTEQPPQGDYLNLDLDASPQPMALPAPQNPWDQFQQAAPPTPQFDTSPANVHTAEGSYGKSSYNVEGVENAMDEAEMMMELEKRNGRN